jgi:hypothetical protein
MSILGSIILIDLGIFLIVKSAPSMYSYQCCCIVVSLRKGAYHHDYFTLLEQVTLFMWSLVIYAKVQTKEAPVCGESHKHCSRGNP